MILKAPHIKTLLILSAMTILSSCQLYKAPNQTATLTHGQTSTHWQTSALFKQAGANNTQIEGDPTLIQSRFGEAVAFDGDGDRLVIQENPIFDAEEFTIEAIIYPNDVYPNNSEPRFLHIESSDNSNRRITMELRLNQNKEWYFDGYIKSDQDSYTLIDSQLTHPTKQWVHTAITYKDKVFTSYINGKKELSAQVQYLPISKNAKTSLGARLNKKYWFNGNIHSVTTSATALKPEEFKTLHLLLKSKAEAITP